MAHICNPCYLRGRDPENQDLRLARAKKLARPHLIKQARCGGAHLVAEAEELTFLGQPGLHSEASSQKTKINQ
jgi:hypothetical protein